MKSVISTLITFLIILTNSVFSFGQNSRFFDQTLMPSSLYTSFARDSRGFLWIGSGYGLMRFDGNNFKCYLHNSKDSLSLIDNRVHCTFIDRQGILWVSTANGLQFYDYPTDRFHLISLPDKDFNGYISDVIQLQSGKILFIASGVGVYTYDKTSRRVELVKSLAKHAWNNRLNRVIELGKDELLFSCHQGGLLKLSPSGKISTIAHDDEFITKMIKEPSGNILMISDDNVWRFIPSSGSIAHLSYNGSASPIFKDAIVHHSGNIFIATNGNGILQLAPGSSVINDYNKWTSAVFKLNTAKIGCIFEDDKHNVWLGCPNQGIVLVPPTPYPFNFYNFATTLPQYSSTALALAHDDEGALWCSFEADGLYKISPAGEVLAHISTPHPINSICDAHDGTMLVGMTHNGIFSINKATNSLSPVCLISGKYNINSIVTDRNHNIYAAVDGKGVVIIDHASGAQRWLYASDNEYMVNNWIPVLFVDSHNRLWMGHYSGVSCYDIASSKFIKMKMDDLLRQGSCNDITETRDGNIWIGTSQGLIQYNVDKQSISRYVSDQGLADNAIFSVTTDADNNIWACTRQSICRFNTRSHEFSSFYGGHGLMDKSYSTLISGLSGSRIFVAGQLGITVFSPHDIHAPKFDSGIVVTDLLIKDIPFSQAQAESGRHIINDDLFNLEKIDLDYTENSITLSLSTMDFRDDQNVRYRYKIVNLDKDWMDTHLGESSIHIEHLQPGDYTLLIKAFENGASSEVKSISIHVSAPWYLSFWAKIIYFLALLLIAGLIFTNVRRRRAEQLNEAKLQFFINISHEIRSPMTLILGPLESLMKQSFDEKTHQRLLAIHRNANRILDLINQLLDIRKIDKGKMEIKCSETNLVEYTGVLVDMFRTKAEARNINLSLNSAVEDLNVWIDRNNFDKVLVNLLDNAFKYTPQGGSIAVEIARDSNPKEKGALRDFAVIRVSDTGIGIDEKKAEKIFDRFYQDKSNQTSEPMGFGIGLNLCRLLVQLHHGSIKAYKRKDCQGSCFEIHIPLGSDHLSAEEMEEMPQLQARQVLSESRISTADDSAVAKNIRHKTNYRLLVVDDDVEICEYLNVSLSTDYKVVTAHDGDEAWRVINEGDIDLVISDVNMPGLNGLQLLRNIKTNCNTNHIPVILLTTKTEFADRKEGWERGADGYLSKPFSIDELIALINNLIDNRLRLKGKFSGAQEQSGKIDAIEVKSNDELLMNKITEMINSHIDDPNLNVEKLGQEVGISRAHLHRKMKEMIGMSPSDFIRNIRLKQACELLRNTDNDVTQIAYSVGFTSQTHFSTAFKKFTGISPTEYRTNRSATVPPAQKD